MGARARAVAAAAPIIALQGVTKVYDQGELAVPALRTRYLGYVRDMAEKWLDWRTLEPVVRFQKKYRVPIFLGEFSAPRC